MPKIRVKNVKPKNIKEYIKKDNFSKCKSLSDKSSLEVKCMISKLSSDCISKAADQSKALKELYSILEDKVHGKSIILRKSVMVSLCLVYTDILPTYKITVMTEEQKQQKMKDDTIKTYSEMEILLNCYQKYVRVIESVIKKTYDIETLNHIRWTESDESTLLKCCCKLYENNPAFNFSKTLLKLIVPYLNTKNPKYLKCASETMKSVITNDLKLEASLNICEEIKQYSTSLKFNFLSTLLKPLLLIDLEDVNVDEQNNKSKFNKDLASRKQKKYLKKNKEHFKQMEQISAKESLDVKYKNNSQIIRMIFYIYFRVLKRKNVQSKLLETVLNGIFKYGRLIDCKLLPEVFRSMLDISGNIKLSMENRLRSIFVSLSIVTSGKASDILDIDPGNFCAKLVELGSNSSLSEESVILVIDSCTKLLVKRRSHISQTDVQKLIVMLIELAWNQKSVLPLCSTVLMSLVRYLRIYPQLQYLFDDDEDLPDDAQQSDFTNESVRYLHDMCKISTYEIAGFAKKLKKFFVKGDADNSLYELKGALENLTRMKTEECINHLKSVLAKPVKRASTEPCGDESCEKKKPKL